MNMLYKVPLVLEGFELLHEKIEGQIVDVNPETIFQLHFREEKAQNWYDSFCERLVSAMGKEFLPIYRMADGEFNFISQNWLTAFKRLISKQARYINTCWGEHYSFKEYLRLRKNYIKQLKGVSLNGILAIHFVLEQNNVGFSDYIKPVNNFLKKNKIVLNETNYTAFYFIYALLSSERSKGIFKNKNVLIITHLDKDKKQKLSDYFSSISVSNIEFYNISANKSFYDIIHLNTIKQRPDIALIGGGIGSINILSQLEPLQIPCIDAGYMLEVFADESLRGGRIYVK